MPSSIGRRLNGRSSSSRSLSSDEGSLPSPKGSPRRRSSSKGSLEPPVLVYHASARSIVFRDHLRRAAGAQDRSSSHGPELRTPSPSATSRKQQQHGVVTDDHQHVDQMGTMQTIASDLLDMNDTVVPSEAGIAESQIGGFQPRVTPLPRLSLGSNDQFEPLLTAPASCAEATGSEWTPAEEEVVRLLETQHACVKTIKNSDWAPFIHRFKVPETHPRGNLPNAHDDKPPSDEFHFNSFVTSTSLLPPGGKKMRTYGSSTKYSVGVVFALPAFASAEVEDMEAKRTETWSWPSGYSAKTEFNIDGRGRLINGRAEALRSLSTLRSYNEEYVHGEEYTVAMRRVSGLSQVPYNEVFLRVGGLGRVVMGRDVVSGEECTRSFEDGVGLPVALFIRSATFGDLISLLRTRARVSHYFGDHHFRGIPLVLISPDLGVRVITDSLQKQLWKIAAQNLNPFQNGAIGMRTTMERTDEGPFQQKVDELLDLDDSNIRDVLTPEECTRIAGGFGATDESVAALLKQAMMHDRRINSSQQKDGDKSHLLQDVVNEGLTYAVRSGDYHTSRQLLMLYSLVASMQDDKPGDIDTCCSSSDMGDSTREHKRDGKDRGHGYNRSESGSLGGLGSENLASEMENSLSLLKQETNLSGNVMPAPPPPPPLDTDRLRRATNSDGLLAVLGAAQILKSMQDGGAKKRVEESISAVEEWVNYGEQSMAFRLSSWLDQRAAQGDLKIATNDRSNMMAFVSNKAITNRKAFAQQLRQAAAVTDFTNIRFLACIKEMISKMHSPCLRLELLQYVLGLDNRYSVAHVARSVELAATCLGMSSGATSIQESSEGSKKTPEM